ncbi:MAG TPA: DUF6526 family protein [Candidatus Acidoferrales bacterium]|jgi:hypothetical protein|nr:DUF6526 family protein [Candidatus Acidoferrales bacterium]
MSQNYSNHAKFVPPFHFFVLPVLLLNVGWSIYHIVKTPSADTIIGTAVAAAILLAALLARMFALKVQDRLIRLEMRLRMAGVLPPDLRMRIPEFTVEQLIALRFASDAELPMLSKKVLDENIAKRKPIKQMVKDWQADELRA